VATYPEFDQALKRATALRLQDRLLLINERVETRQATGWLIERQYPTQFSKPEIQISLSNSFNQTVNVLSITIAPQEIREIEAIAESVRASVKERLRQYRPSQRNGDQERNGSVSMTSRKSLPTIGPARAHKDRLRQLYL